MQSRSFIFMVIAVFINHLFPLPTLSLEQGFVYCPAYPCACNLDHGSLVIDCQGLHLTQLPKFLTFHGEVRMLSLKQNGVRRLPANAFRDLHVQSLDLTENVISHVHPQAFGGLGDWIEELHLEVNGLEGIPSAAIHGLKKLKVLRIIGCMAHTLHGSIFQGMDSLLELHLQNCSIQAIEPGGLSSLKLLQVLNLSGNLLTSQALTQVTHLYGLRRLVLSRNRLTRLPGHTFKHLRHLRYLDLSDNQMTKVDVDAFKGLRISLTILKLQHNQLTSDVFLPLQHLRNLQQLTLSSNIITSVPIGSLHNLEFLVHLELDRNGITKLDKQTLKGTEHNLQVLWLSDNPISVLTKDTFQDHINLRQLLLDNTKLGGTLLEEVFHGINGTLRKLSLSEVGLTSLDLSALSGITTLADLDVSRNAIAEILHGTFSRMHNLKKLDLSQNRIQILPDFTFRGLEASLESVDLHSNSLSTISGCVFEGFQNLRKLHLQNNPLVCDCRMAWLHKWLQVTLIEEDRSILEWQCVEPEALAGRVFGSLNMADLQCSDNTTMLGPLCNFNSSDSVHGFKKTLADHDDLTPSRLLPTSDISRTPLHLEVQPKDQGSLLALWNVTSPTSSITGYHLTLHRLNDSKQKADVTLAAEVTQYLFTGLAGEITYQTCVTVLGKQSIPLGGECVPVTTRGNHSVHVDDKVTHQTSSSLPLSITALIWSYVSGCFIAFILCIVLVVLIHRRRHQRQAKSTAAFSPGYWAWEGNQSCSSLDDASSSVYHLDSSFPERDHDDEHGKVIDAFDRNSRTGNDADEKGGMKDVKKNLPVDYFVFGKRILDGGELESDDGVGLVMNNLADSAERISSKVDKDCSGDSEITLGKGELAAESFTEEDSIGSDRTLEIRALGMERPAFNEEVGVKKMQDGSGALRLGTFGKEDLEKGQGTSGLIMDRITFDSLVSFEGSLKRRVPEVKAVKDGKIIYFSVAESEKSPKRQRNLEQAVSNPAADLRNGVDPKDTLERINALDKEAFREGMHMKNKSNSSEYTLERTVLGIEAPRRLEILCEDQGKDIAVSHDAQSIGSVVNPLHQHLPATYVLTSFDLADNYFGSPEVEI